MIQNGPNGLQLLWPFFGNSVTTPCPHLYWLKSASGCYPVPFIHSNPSFSAHIDISAYHILTSTDSNLHPAVTQYRLLTLTLVFRHTLTHDDISAYLRPFFLDNRILIHASLLLLLHTLLYFCKHFSQVFTFHTKPRQSVHTDCTQALRFYCLMTVVLHPS